MRKRKSLIAALTMSLLIQGVTGNMNVDRIYAEQSGSESVVQMSSEKEVVNLSSFSAKSNRTENFNGGWKFYLGDAGSAEGLTFDDAKWEGVSLPHDYSIHQSYSKSMEAESGYLPGGIGWYRKHFSLSKDMADKELRLDFDGVYMDATVWINGHRLGSHPYGYTPFSFNLSKYLKFDGSDNVVAVKVNHQVPSSRWYSGSGIYRDVKLQVMDKVHVDLNGVKIETPGLKDNQTNVDVNIKTRLVNALTENKDVKVKAKVFKKGSEDEVVGAAEISKSMEAGKTSEVSLSLTANSPKLWDTENPNLYTVRVEVLDGERVVDTYDSDYGFRWFTADKDKGTFLNGKPIKLKGVCMHHDQGALGAAAYKRAIERQVEILQDMGSNSIRVTHNPASQALIDICNEKGVLLIEEMFDGWMYAKNGNNYDYARWFNKAVGAGNEIVGAKANMTWAEFDLKSAIARGQNSPAIVMWSLGNEIQEGAGGSGYNLKAKELIKWAKEADSTRMLTIGSNAVKGGSNEHTNIGDQLTAVGGMSGTNYSNGANYDYLRNAHPDWIIYGSETASSVNSRGVYTNRSSARLDGNKQLTSYDESRVSWGALASEAWYDVVTRDFVAGEYVWTGFDYIGEPTPANGIDRGPKTSWPSPKNSYFGIIDTAGFPKDSYYFYQSQWNDKKHTLHVLPSWNEDSLMKSYDGKVKVVVYSDAAKVELKLNGKSLGTQEYVEHTTAVGYKYKTVNGNNGHRSLYMVWEVPYEAGTLEAVAYDKSGDVIAETEGRSVIKTSGRAAKLVVKADRNVIKTGGEDLSYITVDVTDEDGNIVPDAANDITFSVEGEGEVVGVDNGSSPDHTPYNSLTRKAHAGKVLAIVKSGKRAGKVTVKATSSGLTEGEVVIDTEAVNVSEGEKRVDAVILSRNYYVKKGNRPKLPKTLVVRYNDDTTAEKEVKWDAFDEELINKAGTFTVTGSVEGKSVSVFVTMIDEVGGVLNYSTATQKNRAVVLPESRPAVLMDGRRLSVSFPVKWDEVPAEKYANEGIVEVSGRANVFGKEVPVYASIRVSEEEITFGKSVTSAAHLSQDIPENLQSDNIEAIKDGSTSIGDSVNDYNATVWTNYKFSQTEGNNGKSEITFRYDTQQRIGKAVVYFGKDGWAMQYPDAGTTKLMVSENGKDWKDVNAKEIIGTDSNRVQPYTYEFEPLTATYVKLCVTNSTKPRMRANNCIGITEVELLGVTSRFNMGSDADLAALIVNEEEVSEDALVSGVYETPAQIAEINGIETVDNAAYTILPAYENEVKIILESEDHGTVKTFVIKLDKEVKDEESNLKEYPRTKLTASAVSEYNGGKEHEGPASYAIDGRTDTHWHTDWSGGKTANSEEKRTITLTLAEAEDIAALCYYPRTYDGFNGFITEYRIEVKSLTEDKWVEVAKGNWNTREAKWYDVNFAQPVKAREIRLVGVHTYSDQRNGMDKHASVGELKVMIANDRDKLEASNTVVEIEGLREGKFAMDVVNDKHPAMPQVKVTKEGRVLKPGIDYKVKYLNNKAVGTAKVEVSGIIKYRGKLEKEFEIVQNPKRVEKIIISENPVKTIYKIGEKFEASGLELLVVNSDETTERVKFSSDNKDDFIFSPSQEEAIKAEHKKVRVSYKGKDAEIDIFVEETPVQNGGNNSGTPSIIPVVPVAAETKPEVTSPETTPGTEIKDETTPLGPTDASSSTGAVNESAFSKLLTKLNKSNKTKALAIRKKINKKKGLTLEQFAKELVNKKIIKKATKKESTKLLKGVKTSKWAKSYVAALIKTGVLSKKDLKNVKKKVTEDYAAKVLEKLMVKNKKAKK